MLQWYFRHSCHPNLLRWRSCPRPALRQQRLPNWCQHLASVAAHCARHRQCHAGQMWSGSTSVWTCVRGQPWLGYLKDSVVRCLMSSLDHQVTDFCWCRRIYNAKRESIITFYCRMSKSLIYLFMSTWAWLQLHQKFYFFSKYYNAS